MLGNMERISILENTMQSTEASILYGRRGSVTKIAAEAQATAPIKPHLQRGRLSLKSNLSESRLEKFIERSVSPGDQSSQNTGATSLMTESTWSTAPSKVAGVAHSRPTCPQSKIKTRRSVGDIIMRRSVGDMSALSHSDDIIREHVIIENIPEEEAIMKESNTKESKRDKLLAKNTGGQRQKQVIEEYEEQIAKMRTQMSNERKGFAMVALKAKEEREKLVAQITDLKWKVTLRGKKVQRLEKVIDKFLNTVSSKNEKSDSSSSQSEDENEQSDSSSQSEVDDENEQGTSIFRSKDYKPQNEESIEEINRVANRLSAELNHWKENHDEVALNYDELALAVELKCSKFEKELEGFREVVKSLAEYDMLKPTAHGCLLESLDDLTKTKDELRDFIVKNPRATSAGAPLSYGEGCTSKYGDSFFGTGITATLSEDSC